MRRSRIAAFALLSVACGRTDLELWVTGASGAGAGAMAGAPASTAGGAPAGGTGGTASNGPDFDFTPIPDQATAYQVHPSHSGSQQSVTITPPLARIWTQHFDAGVSYPVMVDSRVFVSVTPIDAQVGPLIAALDAASGATLWTATPLGDDTEPTPAHLAYDRGLLFVANRTGHVLALEPATGEVRWRARLAGVSYYASLPLAAGGAVFVGAGISDFYRLFALDERDGTPVYSVDTPTGGDPTLGEGKIFSTGSCDRTFAFDAATGSAVWQTSDDCLVGDATRTMIHDGVLWEPAPDGPTRLLETATGKTLGTLADDNSFFLVSAAEKQMVVPAIGNPPALRVFGETIGAFRWQVALPALPLLPALTTPDTVYVVAGSEDKFLYGVDLVTRQFSWQSSEPVAPAEIWNETGLEPLQAMAASGGRIVVAYGRWLSAFAAAN